MFCSNSGDKVNTVKINPLSELQDESKPLLLEDNTNNEVSTPNPNTSKVSRENGTEENNDKNSKPISKNDLQVDPNNEKLARSRSLGKSVLLRKATMWRRKSRHTLQLKNEDRERKATETLAIVLGIFIDSICKT